MAAVRQNGEAIRFIQNKTHDLCLAAVTQNGNAIKYVEQTPDLCLIAVMQNGLALESIKQKTPEICLTAVMQNGLALKYIKQQTPKYCSAAYNTSGNSVLKYVDFSTIQLEDVVKKITTQIVEINVANKIIYKNYETGEYHYIDRLDGLYPTVLNHIQSQYNESEYNNIKKLSDQSNQPDQPDQSNQSNDDDDKRPYIIKKNNAYYLYKKVVEIRDVGWILSNTSKEIKNIKVSKYFEPNL